MPTGKTRKPKRPSQYKKEIQRIKRQMKSLEKRGYVFDIDLPKSLRSARNLDLENLYKKAKYIDTDTGELISGKRGREMERSKRGRKAAETRKQRSYRKGSQYADEPTSLGRVVIDNFYEYISEVLGLTDEVPTWCYANANHSATRDIKDPETDFRNTNRIVFRSKLESERNRVGDNILGKRLAEAWKEEQLDSVIDSMLHGYNTDESNRATILLVEIIMGRNLTTTELQQASIINEQMDYWNDSV